MSTRLALREMRRFLGTKEPGVLSVSGRWGVGKTFGWNQMLAEARANRSWPRDRYAYVSVFGVRSIDALKAAIFQATVRLEEREVRPSVETFQELITSFQGLMDKAEKGGRRGISWLATGLSGLPWFSKASDLIMPGAALLIRNQLICIDDIERAGAGLDLADILGFVSSLREEKNCKVVLLLNEEGFDEMRERDFRTHLEKVVDQAVRYTPTAAEAADTALDDADPLKAALSDRVVRLGITNIRVIRRIRNFLSFIERDLAGLHEGVMDRAIAGVALLGWCLFEPGLAPPLEYVRRRTIFSIMDVGEPTPQEAEWNALLDGYGFDHFDGFDEALLAGLEAGGFDPDLVGREAAVIDEEYGKVGVQQALRRPWEILGGGFGNDEAAFKEALVQSIEEHGADMTPHDADNVVSTLRELGEDGEADRLIGIYMSENADKPRSFFDLASHHLRQSPDGALAEAFGEGLAARPLDRDPKELFLKIDRENGWNPQDTEFLASLSETDYLQLFRSLQGGELRSVLHAALRFNRMAGGDPAYNVIGSKAVAALRSLGEESRLNAMRVRPYVGDVGGTQLEAG